MVCYYFFYPVLVHYDNSITYIVGFALSGPPHVHSLALFFVLYGSFAYINIADPSSMQEACHT